MDADFDTLCIAVHVTADDLLPEPAPNARRQLNDAEVVTLAVAQAAMGIRSALSHPSAPSASLGAITLGHAGSWTGRDHGREEGSRNAAPGGVGSTARSERIEGPCGCAAAHGT